MNPSRREFFKRSALTGALVSIPTVWASGKSTPSKDGDKPTVAAIGVGGSRGAYSQGGADAKRASEFGTHTAAECERHGAQERGHGGHHNWAEA